MPLRHEMTLDKLNSRSGDNLPGWFSMKVVEVREGSLTIPLAAGYHKAAEKLLLAEPISAEEALEMKIVNRILPPGEVLDYAIRQSERFNALPPASVRETKRLMKLSWRSMTEKLIMEEAKSFEKMLRSAEAKEAFSAFFERRKPDFSRFS